MALAPHLGALDRRTCRREAERRFSASAMADGYEQIYQHMLVERRPMTRATVPVVSPMQGPMPIPRRTRL